MKKGWMVTGTVGVLSLILLSACSADLQGEQKKTGEQQVQPAAVSKTEDQQVKGKQTTVSDAVNNQQTKQPSSNVAKTESTNATLDVKNGKGITFTTLALPSEWKAYLKEADAKETSELGAISVQTLHVVNGGLDVPLASLLFTDPANKVNFEGPLHHFVKEQDNERLYFSLYTEAPEELYNQPDKLQEWQDIQQKVNQALNAMK